jgi:uncharacterized protein
MPLSDTSIDRIENLLFDEKFSDDTLDYFGLHGLVCASVVGPELLAPETVIETCIDGDLESVSEEELGHLRDCIQVIMHEIKTALDEGSAINLPYEEEDELYDDALASWCAGFVEGLLLNEDKWFEKDEEVSAELLLPYMAWSGLFDNEDFAPILNNKKLMQQLETAVPEQLTDIFLFYHS